jgi:plastocyanin
VDGVLILDRATQQEDQPMRRLTTGLFIVVTVVAVAACSNSGASAAPTTATSQAPAASAAGATAVAIKDFAFSPATATAAAGSKVTWTNSDTTAHTVTFDDGSADSGNLAPGSTFDHTFATAGTFAYHCTIHSQMKGTVTVS